MAVIKKYTKKDGTTAYQFNAYLGIDPETGKSKRTTRRGFKTKKEAKLALSRLELEVESGGLVKQSYETFGEVYEVWFEQYQNTVKPVTADQTKRVFRLHVLPKLEATKINNLTKFTCQKVVNEWSQEYSAFHLIKSITQKMLNYAVSQDIIASNPMQYVIMPRRTQSKTQDKVQFLELSELKTFLNMAKNTLPYHDYLIFRVLAFTGIRKGELHALTWSDIDEVNKTISISKTAGVLDRKPFISTPKTKQSNRLVGLDEITFQELQQWKRSQKKELLKVGIRVKKDDKQLIFHREDNTILYPEYPNKILQNRLKVDITPHSFRHTHASLLFESGASIKDVQARLGHSDIKTTMDVYTHVTKTAERQAIDNLSKYANF